MALPARPRFLVCDPHSTFFNSKIFIAVIAADRDGSLERQRMLRLAMPHQATVNILPDRKQCVCHFCS